MRLTAASGAQGAAKGTGRWFSTMAVRTPPGSKSVIIEAYRHLVEPVEGIKAKARRPTIAFAS